MPKVADRMKFLNKNKKGEKVPDISPEYFKSIEERMNPKDAKIPNTAKKSKRTRSTEKKDKETSDNRNTEVNEVFSDSATKR